MEFLEGLPSGFQGGVAVEQASEFCVFGFVEAVASFEEQTAGAIQGLFPGGRPVLVGAALQVPAELHQGAGRTSG